MMSIRPLSAELQQIAERTLNEIPDRIPDNLQHIRAWISKQPHLKCRTDDQWLLTFLRGCKHNLNKTKEKLDMFYTMKSLIPEFFANRDPLATDAQEFLKRGIGIVLPNREDLPYGIAFGRMGLSDPQKLPHETVLKMVVMYSDILLNCDNCVIGGVHVFVDYKDVSFNYTSGLTPSLIQKVITCVRSTPLRVNGLHLINIPPYYETAFNLIKMFLSKKDLSRIHLYNKTNMSDIAKVIPPFMLPKEYGGENENFETIAANWRLNVESYREWFLEDAAYRSDESKRPEKERPTELLGVQGSFSKLDID